MEPRDAGSDETGSNDHLQPESAYIWRDEADELMRAADDFWDIEAERMIRWAELMRFENGKANGFG